MWAEWMAEWEATKAEAAAQKAAEHAKEMRDRCLSTQLQKLGENNG